jgi:hypothetical protein
MSVTTDEYHEKGCPFNGRVDIERTAFGTCICCEAIVIAWQEGYNALMATLKHKIKEVETFVQFWEDEMSSDAHDWVTDILDILRGVYESNNCVGIMPGTRCVLAYGHPGEHEWEEE